MNARTNYVVHFIVAALFFFCGSVAFAIPKAAEYEDAPVTTGADATRPRLSSAKQVKHQVSGKSKKISKTKPVKTAKPTKKTRTVSGKK